MSSNAKPSVRRPASALRDFLDSEAAGGIILMIVAALAMAVANSPLAESYFHLIHAETGPELTPKLGPMTVHLWINDGLMAIFFLLVGLEIKREFVDGHLATWADRLLPMIAAAAGMALPAMVYLYVAGGDPMLHRGWAIPAATDIAFAIGVLALLGSRAPASLKLFLTTVAIVDDMGAVAIIALFYTASLNFEALAAAGAIWLVMLVMGKMGVRQLWPYLLLAALLWYATLLSGVHATIAGVLAAFAIPLLRTVGAPDAEDSLLHRLEHALAKPVAFVIVPLFGFANAGVSLEGVGADALLSPLPLGIALGLFVGKQLGIFGSVWLTVKVGLAQRPRDASWTQVYGVALLCGIGFTMSLFIGGLAFTDPALSDAVKIGVLMGSIASALAGFTLLRFASKPNR
ncbi:Na+/H+ antiporter NhaA [Sphingorhabdus pulchriflava]|uniref:Na(+)/H(+) antiporter NhaA n=1 Tax=Sphingorhabdus pulchriflava TaxID=2292257 RepID=A0A371B1Y6_9SPHN|nr:Na+/H+ antiporter NhaA [Sphingorhabdus pulchriflava]RDV01609.1 Na+/H+ antiporter NhaA [Sphingorhabdus pulchriflava]